MSLVLLMGIYHGACLFWQMLPIGLDDLQAWLVAGNLGAQQCPRINCGPF
ncbi:hypothetical protein [Pseudomonas sp. Kh13]|nr:hypothetical protein [Pseudomonas sp. Kh13]